MSFLPELLTEATRRGASDIHIRPDSMPMLRIDGSLSPSESGPVSLEKIEQAIADVLPHHVREQFREQRETDFSFPLPDVGRFRINLYISNSGPTFAIRHVKDHIPDFSELNLPPVMGDLAESRNGIILACGTTGSGKSTTLAAMIQSINLKRNCRIITVEDPIEYIFADDQAVISQREVGLDTSSFPAALKHIMRQDPDVIMIGEMRDETSFHAALSAAETGHLVFSTLHSGTAAQSISRILDFFPAAERDQMRLSLAANMRAVFCQRLIPARKGGVVPAVEIMINTSTVRKMIERDKLEKLEAAVETGTDDGMQTFNQSIYRLIKDGSITEKDGMLHASNREALEMNLKGIFLDEANRILAT